MEPRTPPALAACDKNSRLMPRPGPSSDSRSCDTPFDGPARSFVDDRVKPRSSTCPSGAKSTALPGRRAGSTGAQGPPRERGVPQARQPNSSRRGAQRSDRPQRRVSAASHPGRGCTDEEGTRPRLRGDLSGVLRPPLREHSETAAATRRDLGRSRDGGGALPDGSGQARGRSRSVPPSTSSSTRPPPPPRATMAAPRA